MPGLILVPPEAGTLGRRVLSSLVLIPFALAIAWAGSPWLTLLIAAATGGMVWEWDVLTGHPRLSPEGLLRAAYAATAVLLAGFLSPVIGIALGLSGALAAAFQARGRGTLGLWTLIGTLWIVLPGIGFVWLRDQQGDGRVTIFWILALVWAVDIAAYAAGRGVGGPKLLPRVSPKKTWAGLCGGIAAALAIGWASAWLTGAAHWWQIIVLSGFLAMVEQAGDLAESYAKRRFGAKDSSALIPGHGGLLDRLDGMLAVSAVVALLSLLTGRNVLTWH